MRDAFMVVHAHRAIWKERVLLISRNKCIKHANEKFQFLEVVNLLNQIAIMHYP